MTAITEHLEARDRKRSFERGKPNLAAIVGASAGGAVARLRSTWSDDIALVT